MESSRIVANAAAATAAAAADAAAGSRRYVRGWCRYCIAYCVINKSKRVPSVPVPSFIHPYMWTSHIGRVAVPNSAGCYTIASREDCCLYIDGRNTVFGGELCVPSASGQTFTSGVANPEVKKHSGNIIYVDNRPSITRSSNQKEDIKVILQF